MKSIKLYWCRGDGRSDLGKQNFGDYLSPLLVGVLSRKRVEYSPVQQADMIAIGSVLGRERKAKAFGFLPRRLHIWGTGTGAEHARYSGRHYYHAVRGALTLAQVEDIKTAPVLGDPGLLSPMLLSNRKAHAVKRIRVGIIAHYADKAEPAVSRLLESIPGAQLIDVFSPVEEVLSQISSCDFVLSSSMHGLIVADSFGVPNQWLLLSRGRISEYKFSDYYSVFGLNNVEPVSPEVLLGGSASLIDRFIGCYSRPGLERIQQSLVKSFPEL